MKIFKTFLSASAMIAILFGSSTTANALSLSGFYAGVSGGVSKCPTGFSGDYDRGQPSLGGDWGVNLGWISRAKIGAGLSYSGFTSTAGQDMKYNLNGQISTMEVNSRFLINYLAPQLVFQTAFGDAGWYFTASAGAGIMFFKESASVKEMGMKVSASESKNGFAWNIYAGILHPLTKHLSFTANLGFTSGALKYDNKWNHHKTSISISRINLDLGIRYTF